MAGEAIIDMKNRVSTEELNAIVSKQLDALFAHPELAAKIPPLMVWGAPGIGKSTILRRIAEERGIGFIDIRLAQREPVDIRGLPVPNKEKGSVDWLISGDWPRDPNSRGIILFDEITAADRSLQVAAYELILDRRLGSLYKMPDGWLVCAAGNRIQDAAVAKTMSSALANRFLHVELQENAEMWVQWGLRHDIHPAVLGFIRYRPDLLFHQDHENLERGWPSPRSWERVSTILNLFSKEEAEFLVDKMIYGLIGNQAGVEFCAFRKLSEEFDTVLDLMSNSSKEIHVPEKPDRKYAFCAAVVYHLWRGATPEDEQKRIDGFYRIASKLSSDFASMMMMDAMVGNGKDVSGACADKLYRHPGYKAWAEKHGKALRGRLAYKG